MHPPRHGLARISGTLPAPLQRPLWTGRRRLRVPGRGRAPGRLALDANLGMKPPVISVRNLRFEYEDGTVALDDVDFDLQPGDTVALFGANGSAKTTLVFYLNSLLEGSRSVG